VGTAVSKVVNLIPGFGRPFGKALEMAAKGAGALSDKIQVKLSAKLQKGINGMNKADKIMGYIPRRRDLSDEAFEQ
jgi:hypothetical protein